MNQSSSWWSQMLVHTHLKEPFDALMAKTVPTHRHSVWYYLGGLTLFFFLVQLITGILLLIYYTPTADGAHKSVEMIVKEVPYGWLVRSLHSWSANALVLTMLIHMFSVFLMKSYRTPRQILWLTGILLLLLVMGFGFTGYLLPWDQTAYFATKIGTEVPKSIPLIGSALSGLLRGTKDVSGATLTRLFALHVAVLPILAVLILGAHVLLTALFGSSVPVGTEVKKRTYFIPNYALGEGILWMVGFAVLLTVAFLYPWQLGPAYDLAKPTEPPAGVHPEWYFMFLFETLRLVPEWLTMLSFTLVLLFWTAVPWLDRRSRNQQKSPLFTIIGVAAIVCFVGMTTLAFVAVQSEVSADATASAQTPTAQSPTGKVPAANTAVYTQNGGQR